jgi:hypothetical protein
MLLHMPQGLDVVSAARYGVDDIDYIYDDTRSAVVDNRIAIHIAAVAVGRRRRQPLNDSGWKRANALLPARRELPRPVILFAESRRQISRTVIIPP